MKRLAVVATAVALLSACQTNREPGTYYVRAVQDDQFSKEIVISGENEIDAPLGGTSKIWNLRTFIDKKTLQIVDQLYLSVEYKGQWRFYQYAADDTAMELPVVSIARDVGSCPGGYSCYLSEVVGVTLDHNTLKSHVDTGYQVKLSAKSGDSMIIALTPLQIKSQLVFIDKYVPEGSASPSASQVPAQGQKQKLGINFIPLTPAIASRMKVPGGSGVIVTSVDSGTPAEKAGIKSGDIISIISGRPAVSLNVVQDAVKEVPPGGKLDLVVVRAGKETPLSVQF